MSRTEVIKAIAGKELRDRLRNRWILTVTILLVASALIIAFFGSVPVGLTGFKRGGMTMVSLINLAIYLVPLLALALGSFAIIEERERGTLDLLLAYPISSGEYLAGSFLGLSIALSAAILVGFGLSGILILFVGGAVELVQYLVFMLLTLVLGMIFLAVSYSISIVANDKGKAMAVALLVWIGAVFLFDVSLIGILVATGGRIGSALFSAAMMLNPVDVYRLLLFSLVESARAPLGLLEADISATMGSPQLAAVFAGWLGLLVTIMLQLFKRRVSSDL